VALKYPADIIHAHIAKTKKMLLNKEKYSSPYGKLPVEVGK
jgi:hypothetical protein